MANHEAGLRVTSRLACMAADAAGSRRPEPPARHLARWRLSGPRWSTAVSRRRRRTPAWAQGTTVSAAASIRRHDTTQRSCSGREIRASPGVRKRIRNAPRAHPGRRHRSLIAADGNAAAAVPPLPYGSPSGLPRGYVTRRSTTPGTRQRVTVAQAGASTFPPDLGAGRAARPDRDPGWSPCPRRLPPARMIPSTAPRATGPARSPTNLGRGWRSSLPSRPPRPRTADLALATSRPPCSCRSARCGGPAPVVADDPAGPSADRPGWASLGAGRPSWRC